MKNNSEVGIANVNIKVMALWIALMFVYAYADVFSFHRTGYLERVMAGFIGPFQVNQITLVFTGVLMLLPIGMILVPIFMKIKVARWLNIVVGVLYTIVGIGNLVGEKWIYYWLYGIIEILITIAIVIIATRKMKTGETK